QLLYTRIRHLRPGEGESGQLLKLDDLLEARVRNLRVVEGEPFQVLEPQEVFEIRIRHSLDEQGYLSHRLASLGFIPNDLATKSPPHRQCLLLSIIGAGGRGKSDNEERYRKWYRASLPITVRWHECLLRVWVGDGLSLCYTNLP